MGSGE